VDVLGIGEVRTWRAINVAEELGDFADTVRSVVKEEKGIVI